MIPTHRPFFTVFSAMLTVLLGATAALADTGGIASPDVFAEAPPLGVAGHFTLTALDGHTVTDQSFPGKWLVIYFGYTFCPDACPTTLNNIGAALDALGPLADKIQPLFITIDPVRDKPRVMTQYLKSFDPRIIGLRGDPDQLQGAAKQYHVHYQLARMPNGEYEIDHGALLYVVHPNGRLTKLLPSDAAGDKMAAELRKLVQ